MLFDGPRSYFEKCYVASGFTLDYDGQRRLNVL